MRGRVGEALLVACVAMAAGCSSNPAAKQEQPAPQQRELELLALHTWRGLHSPPTVFEDESGVFGGGARALLMAREDPNGGGEFPFFDDLCLAVAPAELASKAINFSMTPFYVLMDGYDATELVFLPVRAWSPGDIADLYRRVTGKQHPTLKGDLSADYKAFLERKGR